MKFEMKSLVKHQKISGIQYQTQCWFDCQNKIKNKWFCKIKIKLEMEKLCNKFKICIKTGKDIFN